MNITIIGAGPSGSWAASLLSRKGHNVTLIDSQAPWEKPCGGGVTAKALGNFDIFQTALPRKQIERITVHFGDSNSIAVTPDKPIAIVSRRELGQYLLDQAIESGVTFVKGRVTKVARSNGKWTITGRDCEVHADFLVGADGATSLVRRHVSTPFEAKDLCITLGYFIPGQAPPHMKIFFVPGFEGYIWSFPRPNHISYGLITRIDPGWTVRAKNLLSNFITADIGADVMEQSEFYSAPVPCLGARAWKNNKIAGDGWALLGDAAGLTDPITGEGIYFAFESARILSETISSPLDYSKRISLEIGKDLARASHMYRRFYRGSFLGGDFKKRTIQFSQRSRTLKLILGNLIAGNQSYVGLKKKLILSAPRISWDLLTGRR